MLLAATPLASRGSVFEVADMHGLANSLKPSQDLNLKMKQSITTTRPMRSLSIIDNDSVVLDILSFRLLLLYIIGLQLVIVITNMQICIAFG